MGPYAGGGPGGPGGTGGPGIGGGGATLLPWVFTSGSPGAGAFWARLAGSNTSCAAAMIDNDNDPHSDPRMQRP